MGWFSNIFKCSNNTPKEKTPEEIRTEEFAKKYPDSYYTDSDGNKCWVSIIERDDKFFCGDMSRLELQRIMHRLSENHSHTMCCGERTSTDRYMLVDVQDLLDYAFSCNNMLRMLYNGDAYFKGGKICFTKKTKEEEKKEEKHD